MAPGISPDSFSFKHNENTSEFEPKMATWLTKWRVCGYKRLFFTCLHSFFFLLTWLALRFIDLHTNQLIYMLNRWQSFIFIHRLFFSGNRFIKHKWIKQSGQLQGVTFNECFHNMLHVEKRSVIQTIPWMCNYCILEVSCVSLRSIEKTN